MLTPVTYNWSKTKQLEVIKRIIQKYPTASDFKQALLQSNDPKLKSLAETIPANMDRYQYIDFLQYVFVKYRAAGKFLTTLLSGIGLGILANYLGLFLSVAPKLNSNSLLNTANNIANDAINGIDPINSVTNGIYNQSVKSGATGAALGIGTGIGGAALTNKIWNWHDNKIQKNIEDLKNSTNNKKQFNYMNYKEVL